MNTQPTYPGTASLLMAALLSALAAGCGGGGGDTPDVAPDAVALRAANSARGGNPASVSVLSVTPGDGSTDVATSINGADNLVTGTLVTANFSQPIDPGTLNSVLAGALQTFTLKDSSGNLVPGTVAMNTTHTSATFTPTAGALSSNASYTASVSTAARTAGGVAMAAAMVWSFKTQPIASVAQEGVSLGTAGSFALLSKTGITDVYASVINGDVGASPITGAAIGLTCAEVKTGRVYTVNAAGPLPCAVTNPALLTTAVGDMELAYSNAAGRKLPNFTELGAGEIGGLTLAPGLYKWGSGVSISKDVTLSGGPNAVWIFQIAGTTTQASATRVTLQGGALAKNVFWQSGGAVSIGTTAHFEGIVLAKTLIAVKTGASANGRLLAQTAVTLQQNAVTQPAP